MMYNLTMRKLLSAIVLIVLVIMIVNLARASYESYKKLHSLNSDQNQLKALKLKNNELKKDLAEKQSDYFLEKEARDKLGFGKAGETAIVVRDINLDSVKKTQAENEKKPNFEKWLEILKINL